MRIVKSEWLTGYFRKHPYQTIYCWIVALIIFICSALWTNVSWSMGYDYTWIDNKNLFKIKILWCDFKSSQKSVWGRPYIYTTSSTLFMYKFVFIRGWIIAFLFWNFLYVKYSLMAARKESFQRRQHDKYGSQSWSDGKYLRILQPGRLVRSWEVGRIAEAALTL